MARLTLAKLLITLGLDQREYKEEMEKARRKARKTSKQIKKDMGQVQRGFDLASRSARFFAGAVGLAAGGTGLGLLINRAADTQDELQKTAAKLGANRAELVALRLAAERYSTFTEQTFDTALQRQTRRVSEAAQGMGEAQDALAALRLDAEELAKLSPDQQFMKIAEAMALIPEQGDRVRLAFKLYDTEGVGLVNTLAEGADGFREIYTEAEEFGLILSDIDSATLAQTRERLDRMGDAAEGAGNKIAVALSPATQVLANDLTNLITDVDDGADSLITLGQGMVIVAGSVMDFGRQFAAGLKFWGALAQEFGVRIDYLRNGLAALGPPIESVPIPELMKRSEEATRLMNEALDTTFDTLTGEDSNVRRLLNELDAIMAKQREVMANDGTLGAANDNAPSGATGGAGEEAPGITPPGTPNARPGGVYEGEEIGPTEAEAQEQAERLAQQRGFVEEMLGLERGMVDEMVRITEMGAEAREGITVDSAMTMASALVQIGQGIFKNNKAFAIAEAIINTHQGITKALASAPPPLSYALAAAVAAKGFASVKAISSSRKGSRAGAYYRGGGHSTPSVSSRLNTSDPQPTNEGASRAGVKTLRVDLPQLDRNITPEEFRRIMEGLGVLIADDYALDLRTNSSLTGEAA